MSYFLYFFMQPSYGVDVIPPHIVAMIRYKVHCGYSATFGNKKSKQRESRTDSYLETKAFHNCVLTNLFLSTAISFAFLSNTSLSCVILIVRSGFTKNYF